MHAAIPALPEGSVLLHIGPHKTGTTAIQSMLAAARDQMRGHGVTYPGRHGAHHREARAVGQRPAGWTHDSEPLPPSRVWGQLARNVRRAPGSVVLSSEFFALCDAAQRARVVDDLGRERLHVLLAARNPASIAVSTWQQVLRDGKARDLETWLEERFRRDSPAAATKGFWSWAEAGNLVEGWREVVDLDRIHVVVIDESDRALLPTTFEQMLSLPPGLVADQRPQGNRGLTAPEAELLRRVLDLKKAEMSWEEWSLLIRAGFARRLLDHRTPPADEARPTVPAWAAAQAAAEAEATIEHLRACGVHVIGDPANLRRVPPTGDTGPIETIPADLAAEGLAGVIDAAQRGVRRAQRRAVQPPVQEEPAGRVLDDVGTRELASLLGSRLRAAAGRRLGGPGRRP